MQIRKTTGFKKDYKKIVKQGYDISRLQIVLNLLYERKPLEIKYYNHKLINSKDFENCFELHIGPDWLLIYKYSDSYDILYLVRTGSHSDLYK